MLKKLGLFVASLLSGVSLYAAVAAGPAGSFINNQNTLQQGATFYISSGTVRNLQTTTLRFNDGTTMTTAASGTGGTGSAGPSAYGSLYTKNGSANQSNISFSTVTLTFFSNAGISTHAVSNATTDSVTVATTGIFNVYANFISSDSIGSSNLNYYICVNGVPSNFSSSYNTLNYYFTSSISGILSLNVGDVVTLCGFANESPGIGLSIVDSQFVVSSAGGIGGTTIISGGSSTSPLGVFKNGVQISSPTSQINFSGNYWDITLGGTSTGTVKLIGGNTNYIQVSNSLQSGATAYPQYLSVGSTNAIQETPLNVSAYHNGASYAPILNILNTGNGGFSASSGGVGFSLKNSSLNNAVLSGIYDSGGSLTAGSETGNLNLLVKNAGSFPAWPQIIIDPNKTTITNRLQGYSDLQLNTLGLFYNVGATEKVIWYHNSGNGTWTYNGDTFTLDKKINFLTGVQSSSVTVIGSNGAGVTYGVTAGSVTVNNLTASQFVKTDANKRLSSQAQISLATDVTGTLSAVNFVSTAAYTVSTQTFSGQNTFSNSANSFSGDGSGLLKISSLTATGVTAGSYTNTNLTVDAQGRITAASNGSSGGGGGIASMRVEDGGAFVVDTSTFDFTGNQFVVTSSGGEGLIALNGSSVTLGGVLTAGSNITITPGTGITTIASTGGGSGSSIYPATATASFPYGFSSSTGVFSSSVVINRKIGISNSTPQYAIELGDLSAGANTTLSIATGAIAVSDSANSTKYIGENTGADSAFSGSMVVLAQNDGTAATAGTRLGGVQFAGYDGVDRIRIGGAIIAHANGTYSGTAAPTEIEFEVASAASATRSTRLSITDASIDVLSGTSAQELRLYEPSGSGTNYSGFKSQAQTGDVVYTLPAADGSPNYALSTNGSATLLWAAVQASDADLDDLADGSLTGSKVGSGVPAANIAAGALGTSVIASSFTATGVTAGSYTNTNLTVDAQGRITTASNGSGGGVSVYPATSSIVSVAGGILTSSVTFQAGTTSNFVSVISSGSLAYSQRYVLPNSTGTVGQVLSIKEENSNGSRSLGWINKTWIKLFKPTDNEPPTSNYATLSVRNNHPILQFDTSTQETAIFTDKLPQDISLVNGLSVYVQWVASTATSGTVGWDVSFERIADAGIDIDSDSFGTAQTITAATVPGTAGISDVTSVSFTQAQLPTSFAAGDMYRVRIRRDVSNDTATGDAEILSVELRLN